MRKKYLLPEIEIILISPKADVILTSLNEDSIDFDYGIVAN